MVLFDKCWSYFKPLSVGERVILLMDISKELVLLLDELSKVLRMIKEMIVPRNGSNTLSHQVGDTLLESCGGNEASSVCALST